MRILKIFNLITSIIFTISIIINAIIKKEYFLLIFAFISILNIFKDYLENIDNKRSTFIRFIIANIIIILISCYYYLSLFGISSIIVDYILIIFLIIIYSYAIIHILFLKRIIERAHIRKLMK